MRESSIESYLVERIKTLGGTCPKFVSPGRRNAPDRIALQEIPPEHRAIVARYIQFVECKAPGKKPNPGQLREHARLRALGFRVEVVDSISSIDLLVASLQLHEVLHD